MASKRELQDDEKSQMHEPSPKRPRKQAGKKQQGKTKADRDREEYTDATWGQKYVFSGKSRTTTIPKGEEGYFEDDADAMAYLASVRQQAQSIPHLLSAPKVMIGPQLPDGLDTPDDEEPIDRSNYQRETNDSRGYYSDGAYTARPSSHFRQYMGEPEPTEMPTEEERHIERYFVALKIRFFRLRIVLESKPPTTAVNRLTVSNPTHIPEGRQGTALWVRTVHDTDPLPAQVALMSTDTVISILRILLKDKSLGKGFPVTERTSRWIWALLARLPLPGMLNHYQIAVVRDLGKRASEFLRSLRTACYMDRHEIVGDDEEEISDMGDHEDADRVQSEGLAKIKTSLKKDHRQSSETKSEVHTGNAPGNLENGKKATEEVEEGEAASAEVTDDEKDVPMDLETDSDAEEGEIDEEMEEARARVLASLDLTSDYDQERQERAQASLRSYRNMVLTANMILTVSGEIYGQLDQLEDRYAFVDELMSE